MRRRCPACQAGNAMTPNRINLPRGLCAKPSTWSNDKLTARSGISAPVMRIRTGMMSAATSPPAANGNQRMGLLDRAMASNPCRDQDNKGDQRPRAIMKCNDGPGRDGLSFHAERHCLRCEVKPGRAVVRGECETYQLKHDAGRAG